MSNESSADLRVHGYENFSLLDVQGVQLTLVPEAALLEPPHAAHQPGQDSLQELHSQ